MIVVEVVEVAVETQDNLFCCLHTIFSSRGAKNQANSLTMENCFAIQSETSFTVQLNVTLINSCSSTLLAQVATHLR